jgi:hypothetical protein
MALTSGRKQGVLANMTRRLKCEVSSGRDLSGGTTDMIPKKQLSPQKETTSYSGRLRQHKMSAADGSANGSDLKLLAEIDFSYNFRVPFPGLVAQW